MAWRHRSERYVEKLATPDTSVGDLVGDVDPVKVAEGRTLGDPETVHYGLLPRTNRGVFGINELPDLAERIQVAMFNVLEERDIQVRGYSLRLPIDVLLVASAPTPRTTPTAAGSSPRSRTGSAPSCARTTRARSSEEVALVAQEAVLVADVPEHLLEVVARLTRGLRESPAVDHRSGVSARFAIAAAEGVAASALRRGARVGEGMAVARVCDVPTVVPTLLGKVEFEMGEEGREAEVVQHLLRVASPRPSATGCRAGPVRLHRAVRRGRDGRDRRAGARPPTCSTRSAPCPGCPRCSTGSGTATTRRPARSPRRSSSCSRACT